jgi:endonuclease YncB( thermonuclease family)
VDAKGRTIFVAVQTENSNHRRYYAIVLTADGHDLNELLVSAGLARIYGTRTPLPDGRDSRTYLARLAELEAQAKTARRGGWGKATP